LVSLALRGNPSLRSELNEMSVFAAA